MTDYPDLDILSVTDRSAGITSIDYKRLRWTLEHDSPVKSVIVLSDATDAASTSTPWPMTHEDDKDVQIRNKSLTVIPISALTLEVDCLEQYWSVWRENHVPHAEHVEDAKFDEAGELIWCCGESVPDEQGPRLRIIAADQQHGPGFVTIGHFVDTAHMWLRQYLELIQRALEEAGIWRSNTGAKVIVPALSVPRLTVMSVAQFETGPQDYNWGLSARAARAQVSRMLKDEEKVKAASEPSGESAGSV